MVEPGDWTGPGGAQQILARRDIDVAVLETARGGIVLRGVGYESNDASVLTNVSSDHLDLQGIHTLPELAEVKATICRITRARRLGRPQRRRSVRRGRRPARARPRRATSRSTRPLAASSAGIAPAAAAPTWSGAGALVEVDGAAGDRDRRPWRDIPITIGGLARHNVANALAAAGGARALGATIEQVGRRPARLPADRRSLARPAEPVPARGAASSSSTSPTTRRGSRPSSTSPRASPAVRAGRAAPITVIIGTAGDRPDDTLRGIGRIAAATRASGSRSRRPGATCADGPASRSSASCWPASRPVADPPTRSPIYPSETAALRAELNGAGGRPRRAAARPDAAAGDRAHVPRGARRRVRAARRARRPADRRGGRADRAVAAPPGAPEALGRFGRTRAAAHRGPSPARPGSVLGEDDDPVGGTERHRGRLRRVDGDAVGGGRIVGTGRRAGSRRRPRRGVGPPR